MRRIVVAVAMSAGIMIATAAPAGAAVTEVAPATLGIWQPLLLDVNGNDLPPGDGGVSFVAGPPGQPLGAGSARLQTATNHGDGSATLQSAAFAGTLLSSIRALSYATYVTQTNGAQLPFLRLTLDLDANGTADDDIFFEPVYQGAGVLGITPQAPVQIAAWQLWDARHGGWWSRSGTAGAGPGAGVKSLDAIVAAAPNARIVNASQRNAGFSVSSGVVAAAQKFDGNVDALTIDSGTGPTTYDFEPGPPPAVNGRSATVEGIQGTVTVKTPGQPAHVIDPLGENVPFGSIIDTTNGKAALTTQLSANGSRQTMSFFDGAFTVRQRRGRNAITDVRLRSARFARLCGIRTTGARSASVASGEPFVAQSAQSKRKAKRKRSKRVVSRLWGDGKGRFRTTGRNSAATVRGTRWLTEERCDGTLTRVRRGVVRVRNLRTGKFVTVRAGRSYLAPLP